MLGWGDFYGWEFRDFLFFMSFVLIRIRVLCSPLLPLPMLLLLPRRMLLWPVLKAFILPWRVQKYKILRYFNSFLLLFLSLIPFMLWIFWILWIVRWVRRSLIDGFYNHSSWVILLRKMFTSELRIVGVMRLLLGFCSVGVLLVGVFGGVMTVVVGFFWLSMEVWKIILILIYFMVFVPQEHLHLLIFNHLNCIIRIQSQRMAIILFLFAKNHFIFYFRYLMVIVGTAFLFSCLCKIQTFIEISYGKVMYFSLNFI